MIILEKILLKRHQIKLVSVAQFPPAPHQSHTVCHCYTDKHCTAVIPKSNIFHGVFLQSDVKA